MRDRIDSQELSIEIGSRDDERVLRLMRLSEKTSEVFSELNGTLSEALAGLESSRRTRLPKDTRLRFVKSWILRMLEVITREQYSYNLCNIEVLRKIQQIQSLLMHQIQDQRRLLKVLTDG